MDKFKLIVAVLVVAGGVAAFYYLADYSDLVRVLAVLGAIAIAAGIALQTEQGRAAWEFSKGARAELRKVVWPTKKETMQVTLVVFALVVMVALFLWAVDWGLLRIVRALQGI